MTAILVFAALFTAVFLAVEHRLNAPRISHRSSLIDFGRVTEQTLHGTPRRRIAFVLLFVVSVLVMLSLPFRVRFRLTPIVGLIAAWLCWETCSVIWSVNARLSLRRLPPWIITAAVGLAVGAALGVEGCVMIIALVCSAFLVVGIGNELFNRPRDLQTDYRFAGTLHPNEQALNCVMLAFSYCWLGLTGSIPSGIAIFCTIAGVAGLALTRSRAAFWAAEAAAVLWIATAPPSPSRIWPFGLAAGILLAGVLISIFQTKTFFEGDWDEMLSTLVLFGRTSYGNTLNGRTLLWQLMLSGTAPYWIFGHGFGAFWDVPRMETIRKTGLTVSNCHSTPLEIFVRSGVIGAILFSATMLAAMVTALGFHGAGGAFLVSIFVFVLLEGLLESSFAVPSSSPLFLFLLLGALAAA